MGDVTGAAVSGSQNQNSRAPSTAAAEAKQRDAVACTYFSFPMQLLGALSWCLALKRLSGSFEAVCGSLVELSLQSWKKIGAFFT